MRDERSPMGDEQKRTLEAYERFRTADDVTGDDVACLLTGARRLARESGRERRRETLIERAAATGLSRDFAELIYTTALQEGVEPAFAFELVRCGVGVRPLDELVYAESPDEDTMTMSAPPDELLAPVRPQDEAAERERRLRLSFRRLRHHIEAHSTPEAALSAFAAEPDVGRCTY
jgi:hypothetical protein